MVRDAGARDRGTRDAEARDAAGARNPGETREDLVKAHSAQAQNWLTIGKIVAAQGLRGELRVHPLSEFPERFEQPGTRWLWRPQAPAPESVQLVKGWFLPKKGLYVVQLQGVTDRNQAEALRDCQLLVPEDDRPALAEGEFHYLDLLGLRVVDQASQMAIGTITNLINAGNDLLEVELFPDLPREIFVPSKNKKPEDAKKPRRVLIPFVEPIVPIVDLAAGKVEITPPPGLLEF